MNEIAAELTGAAAVPHVELGGFVAVMEWVSAGIDIVSIIIMLIGASRFILGFIAAEFLRDGNARMQGIDRQRMELGRYILAGLELFIVSDIIHTALSLALRDLVFLGVLVVIRSVISFFLDREIGEIRRELRI